MVLRIAPRARVRLQLDEVDLAAIFGEERIVDVHRAVAGKFGPDQVMRDRELGQQLARHGGHAADLVRICWVADADRGEGLMPWQLTAAEPGSALAA